MKILNVKDVKNGDFVGDLMILKTIFEIKILIFNKTKRE